MNGTIYKYDSGMLRGNNIFIHANRNHIQAKKHWHNYYEIIFYQKADGCCILNGEKREIRDGCLFLLSPKDFHEIVAEDKEGSYTLIISFNERIIDSSVTDVVTKGPILSYDISPSLSDKLTELYEVFRSEGKYRNQRLRHLFNCILLEVLEKENVLIDNGKDISHIVRESISLMISNPTADLSLGFFAKKFHITEAYFSRLFHKQAGVTFKQYLTSLRLEYARQLLEENKIPIIDVGYECGFNTPSQFYRAFKRAYKTAPSAYRQIKKSNTSK